MAKIKARARSPQGPTAGPWLETDRQAAATEDSTGEAVPMPYCMNAASGARGRRANGTASAILTRLPPNCGEKKCFTVGKNSAGQSGDGKPYEPAPQRGAETP